MNDYTAVRYLCVAEVETGAVRYLGTSMAAAAAKLEPGTCFGRGPSSAVAYMRAANEVARFRRAATHREFLRELGVTDSITADKTSADLATDGRPSRGGREAAA